MRWPNTFFWWFHPNMTVFLSRCCEAPMATLMQISTWSYILLDLQRWAFKCQYSDRGREAIIIREGKWPVEKKHALTGAVSRQLIPHECLISGIDLINRKASGSPQQGGRSKRSVVVVLHLWMRRGEPSCHRGFGATPQTSRADGAGPHQRLSLHIIF